MKNSKLINNLLASHYNRQRGYDNHEIDDVVNNTLSIRQQLVKVDKLVDYPKLERRIVDYRSHDYRPVRLNKPKTPDYIVFATQQVRQGKMTIEQAKVYTHEQAKLKQRAALRALALERADAEKVKQPAIDLAVLVKQ